MQWPRILHPILMATLALGATQAFARSHFISYLNPTGSSYMLTAPVHFGDTPLESPVWLRYKSFVSPVGQQVKFLDMRHLKSSGAGACWEISVAAGATADADWVFWANTGTSSAPNWVLAADDVLGVRPRLRLWITGNVTEDIIRLRLSPYFPSSLQDADVNYTRFDSGTGEASCLGTTPALKIDGSTVTVIGPR